MAEMSGRDATLEAITESGVIAVCRGVDREAIVPTARALVDGGVTAIEITADDPGATEKLSILREELVTNDDTPGSADDDADADNADADNADADNADAGRVVVGAGTVLDPETASAVIDAGASFVVTPHTAPDVVRTCNRRGVLSMCGVLTPTETVRALEAGADVLKVFPASSVGPDHLSALSGPFGEVSLVPTGGVTLDNARAYLKAGAIAVGVGGDLVDSEAIEAEAYDRLEQRAGEFVDAVSATRQG